VSIRLAQYARRCVAPSDRILVLWFAPEIHFDADRLMAGRHLYYFASFNTLEAEQAREVEKVGRFKPPLVFANRNNYAAAAEAFPGLIALVERDYTPAVTFEEDGDEYRILTRNDARAVSSDGQTGWPCYVESK
jgi:hypothetical protein